MAAGLVAAGLGVRRCEVFERIECAAAQSAAAGDPALVEVSRARATVTFDKMHPVFEKIDGAAAFNGKATVQREVQRAGRIPPACTGRRLFGRRRRRRSLLLDDSDGEGDGDAMRVPRASCQRKSLRL